MGDAGPMAAIHCGACGILLGYYRSDRWSPDGMIYCVECGQARLVQFLEGPDRAEDQTQR